MDTLFNQNLTKDVDNGANCFNLALHFGDGRNIEFTPENIFSGELDRKFNPVSEATPKYGDIGVIYKQGKPIHAFVSIADGWAYTKNGTGFMRPFRFQRVQSLLQCYSGNEIKYFERKDTGVQPSIVNQLQPQQSVE